MPMLGPPKTISWNGPGVMIIPKAIATARSATPKMFQRIAAFRPSAVPAAMAVAAGHGEEAGQHIASSCR